MSRPICCAAALLAFVSWGSAEFIEFYGGDADGRGGLSSEENGLISDAWIFDDFDHRGGPIVNIWGNFLMNYRTIDSVKWEIRQGVSKGNGGTLMASGRGPATQWQPTGRIYFGFTESLVRVDTPGVDLPPARYHLSMAPVTTDKARCFFPYTSAQDLGPTSDPNPPPIGTPHNNENSFFRSTHFGVFYGPTRDQSGLRCDFTFGVTVPEPATWSLLVLGGLALLKRR